MVAGREGKERSVSFGLFGFVLGTATQRNHHRNSSGRPTRTANSTEQQCHSVPFLSTHNSFIIFHYYYHLFVKHPTELHGKE
mmetsp:Transcript_19896/g.46445  ORF Transcript_19896/g.46445 Transcript_19896/m.46445 type:complete len:82 (-) Transcript_19896:50-295(-)